MRRAGHEIGRIFGKERGQRLRNKIGKIIGGNLIPDIEKEMST
jgi:hypothetical protein